MAPAFYLWLLLPDDFQIFQCRLFAFQVQPGPANHRPAGIFFAGFNPAQINHIAGRIIGSENNVAKAALTTIINLGHAGDLAFLPLGIDQLQLARLFGDQHPAIGQEGHRPWFVKTGDCTGLERLAINR